MIVGQIVKFTLTDTDGVILKAGQETDVTPYVGSWKDLEVEMERDDTSGVITEVSLPVDFHEDAAMVLDTIFNAKEMNGKAVLKVYRRADYSNDYTLVKALDLDFSTYKKSRTGVEIEGINNTLASFLSSDGRTKYDIPVLDVTETTKWYYQRMQMMAYCPWTIPTWDGSEEDKEYYTIQFGHPKSHKSLFMSVGEAEMVKGGMPNIFQDQSVSNVEKDADQDIFKTDQFFFQAKETNEVRKSKLKIDLTFHSTSDSFRYALVTTGDNTGDDRSFIIYENEGRKYEWRPSLGVVKIQEEITLNFMPNTRFAFIIIQDFEFSESQTIWISEMNTFEISYWDKGPELFLDVINPETLANRLLSDMTGSETFTCSIDWKPTSYVHRLCAAETARGFNEAKIHTSMNDFIEWMRVLGYEYGIDGNILQFKSRDAMFESGTISLSLKENEVSGLQITADPQYAFTGVKIGFDKQDYDSVNGRFEANGTFEYNTDYTSRDENVLELISPYRGDSIGFELLCWNRGDNTTDDDSDNDVFCVALKQSGSRYDTYYDEYLFDLEYTKFDLFGEVSEGPKMFNAPYCPVFLVSANASLIGISTRKLKFASVDMSNTAKMITSSVSSGSMPLYNDLNISSRIFKPVAYTFNTGNFLDLPDRENGLVEFVYEGVTYKGYVRKLTKNYAAEKENEWELWAVP